MRRSRARHRDALVLHEAVLASRARANVPSRPRLRPAPARRRVGGLTHLEVDVWVLGRAADERMVRAQRRERCAVTRIGTVHAGRRRTASGSRGSRARCGSRRRSARTARATRACGLCNEREVVGFLHRRRGQLCEARRPARPCVLWSPKIDSAWEASARAATGNRWRQFAGDLVHVRDHQQKPLRGGERRRKRAALERAVHRPGGAALALHLDDRGTSPQMLGRPWPVHSSASSAIVDDGVIG